MNLLRLKETMLMNKVEFIEKTLFFLVGPETYWVMCYGDARHFHDRRQQEAEKNLRDFLYTTWETLNVIQ